MTTRERELLAFYIKETTDMTIDQIETIEEVRPHTFYIENHLEDPYNGFLFEVEITDADEISFNCTRTAYGELGAIVYDRNLNHLRNEYR